MEIIADIVHPTSSVLGWIFCLEGPSAEPPSCSAGQVPAQTRVTHPEEGPALK